MILTSFQKPLDQEWVQLLIEAKTIGITLQEIEAFLQGKQCTWLKSDP
ncbi:anti-repressor SinI family protein [Bacillus nitroreducens]